MMRRVIVLIVLVSLLVVAGIVQGQEPICSDEDVQAVIDEALTLLEGGDYQSAVEARGKLAALDSVCLGLDFKGTAGSVHGPLDIPEGIYRVTIATNDFFIMKGTILEGECGDSYDGEFILFNEFGTGEFEVEKILKSDGCSVLLETSNIFAPYTVTFEKLK